MHNKRSILKHSRYVFYSITSNGFNLHKSFCIIYITATYFAHKSKDLGPCGCYFGKETHLGLVLYTNFILFLKLFFKWTRMHCSYILN